MSEKMKEPKCCTCKSKMKELNNEELGKVTGGDINDGLGEDAHLENGKWICHTWKRNHITCPKNKTVNGVNNVCVCDFKHNGGCCRVYGDKCNCQYMMKVDTPEKFICMITIWGWGDK